jgi:hypothetical protein
MRATQLDTLFGFEWIFDMATPSAFGKTFPLEAKYAGSVASQTIPRRPRSMRMKFLAHTIGEREQAASSSVDTDIPARLDRRPWSGFHTKLLGQ